MTDSIQEQLLKMGLVSARQAQEAQQARASDRRGSKRKGRKPSGAGRRPTERGPTEQSPTPDPNAAPPSSGEVQLVAQIAESGRLQGKTGGSKRFYFETRDGRLPYVEVDGPTLERLESGRAAVCESPEGAVSLIEGEAAARIAPLDRRWLRAWAG